MMHRRQKSTQEQELAERRRMQGLMRETIKEGKKTVKEMRAKAERLRRGADELLALRDPKQQAASCSAESSEEESSPLMAASSRGR